MKAYSITLAILAVAFFNRVLGQVLVVLFEPSFLPPMEAWYSGLVPYPVLLAGQLLILLTQCFISVQLWVGRGFVTSERPRVGAVLKWLSVIYFLAMAMRCVIVMTSNSQLRWQGHAIPIVFHCVLALYVYLLSRRLRGFSLFGGSSERHS